MTFNEYDRRSSNIFETGMIIFVKMFYRPMEFLTFGTFPMYIFHCCLALLFLTFESKNKINFKLLNALIILKPVLLFMCLKGIGAITIRKF